MRPLLLALAAAAIVAGAAGLASGQGPSPEAETRTYLAAAPPAPLEPGATAEVPVEVTYAYQEGSSAVSDGPTLVFLSVRDAPSWIDARFGTWVLEAPVEVGGTQAVLTTTLPVALEGDAPAGEEGAVELEAYGSENGGMAASSGSTTVPVQVADGGSQDGSGSASTASSAGTTAEASALPTPGPATAAALASGLAGLALGRAAGSRG